jgi:hypothetical protein
VVVIPQEVRTVWGLSAEGWAIGCFSLVVISICCHELGRFLASLAAGHYADEATRERPSAIPFHRLASTDLQVVTARQRDVLRARSGLRR